MVSVLFSPSRCAASRFPIASWCRRCAKYNSDDGSANDRHLMHLGNMSLGCAGL